MMKITSCYTSNVRAVIVLIGCVMLSFICGAQKTITVDERMQWWKDAKFGMFLHWGLYSQAAGDWNGKPYKGNEHFMIYEKLSLKQYGSLADNFNPVLFDAEKWVRDAKKAGMQYIVITSKHHDGFAMFNSPCNDYNIVKRTPFKRDPMKELAAACKKYGLKLGFYYSLGRDWQDPDVPTDWPTKGGRSNVVDYPNEDAKDFSKYFERKVKPQIRELLTQYGPVGVLWFDTPEGIITKAQCNELLQMIRDLQPACIVNSRIGPNGSGMGDYKVSEQTISMQAVLQPWEACITMSRGWGYNKYDTAWKSPELIVRQLVEIVAKGGNLLLNIGPKGSGEFPTQAVDRLHTVGDWMKVNSEAIYGTHPLDSACEQVSNATLSNAYVHDADADVTSKVILPDIYFTAKEKTVYVIARSWQKPMVDVHTMTSGKYAVQKVSMLGSKEKIQWKQTDQGLTLNMPKNAMPEIPVYVFKIELK